MTYRLPKRVNLGRGYWVRVALASKAVLADLLDDDESIADAIWEPALGDGLGYAGIIYVYGGLSAQRKWEAYWHELIHAINDINAYDRDHPLIT